MVCIGEEITDELECEPARYYIKRYIRYKYVLKPAKVFWLANSAYWQMYCRSGVTGFYISR